MNERPILFSGAMVRAILAGTKTQTRRVAPVESIEIRDIGDGSISWAAKFTEPIRSRVSGSRATGTYSGGRFTRDQAVSIIAADFCPYGKPGDRLWVRETWGLFKKTPDDHVHACVRGDRRADGFEPHYRATDTWDMPAGAWRPSIHMPRWACRLELEITGVRVERLQSISEADAIAEGIEKTAHDFWSTYGQLSVDGTYSPAVSFHALWQSINGAEGPTSWTGNPWVWVVEFKRVEVAHG